MYFLLAFILSASLHAPPSVASGASSVQPVPVTQLNLPTTLTLYKPTGEQVAVCTKLSFPGTEPTLSNCSIEKGFTLDDVMNSWLDAYAHKTELEVPSN